ncbi:MAG TPA: hypothetical protein VKV24_08220 [Casimicrobiaceae bacterium]|nr:hypothetical protein [Casimicrobiaceae bacterium]
MAYWYLRLNGFLTTANFVVHPDRGNEQETDVDILGVRFPYRAENPTRPMKDDELFARAKEKTFVAIAEVKSGRCGLNGPWTNPRRGNMLRVVMAVGAFPNKEAELVAAGLHDDGRYRNQLYHVSLMCFGRDRNPEVEEQYSHVPQILWPNVLSFIYRRFGEISAREGVSSAVGCRGSRALGDF